MLIQPVLCVLYYACRQSPAGPTLGRSDAPQPLYSAENPSKYSNIQYVSKVGDGGKEKCDNPHTDTHCLAMMSSACLRPPPPRPPGWTSSRLVTFCSATSNNTRRFEPDLGVTCGVVVVVVVVVVVRSSLAGASWLSTLAVVCFADDVLMSWSSSDI